MASSVGLFLAGEMGQRPLARSILAHKSSTETLKEDDLPGLLQCHPIITLAGSPSTIMTDLLWKHLLHSHLSLPPGLIKVFPWGPPGLIRQMGPAPRLSPLVALDMRVVVTGQVEVVIRMICQHMKVPAQPAPPAPLAPSPLLITQSCRSQARLQSGMLLWSRPHLSAVPHRRPRTPKAFLPQRRRQAMVTAGLMEDIIPPKRGCCHPVTLASPVLKTRGLPPPRGVDCLC